ncbi:hypothetical protein CNMCM5793_002736 [Aspergillus hiratsukae]|uniref:Uncharacterized protein n=1 Tax=Aspergillus hiratsukae TaxID=1194566 RepID=A0A8H6PE60_9EURO|nr:hypothetical protein CNMCM5793_002736 [Aspergillus hiratsukae]KAF7168015.1 hypothetical protein CNMCM6106_003337 [Aspergillus hiratsukae]
MERHYLEEEPNSAPQFVASSAPSTPSYFPPGHNDKYVVNKEEQTQWDAGPPPPFIAGDTKKKKRWVWIFVALGIFAIIVVAAVVGGVVGSRAAHENSTSIQSDSALTSSPTSSAHNATNTTTPTTTTISNNNWTSTTTTLPSSTTSANNQSSANNGTTRLATFDMYETDTCGGVDDSFAITSAGSQRCVPVPSNKRSIRVIDNSCIITTWSGGDCRGSSFRVPDTTCHSVLYAAVSVYC